MRPSRHSVAESSRRAVWQRLTPLALADRHYPAALALAACVLAIAVTLLGLETTVALAVAQTFGVLWLFLAGWSSLRGWATAAFVCAAGWVPTFLVPTWIYVVDPGLLDITTAPEEALAIVNLSLFSLILGVEVSRRHQNGSEHSGPRRLRVIQGRLRKPVLAIWLGFGGACLFLLFALNGGPAAYLSNLDRIGEMNAGLTYVIWGVLALKFAAFAVICERWSSGGRARPAELVLVAAAIALVGLLGARAFVAIALVELGLFYHLVRKPLRVRAVGAITLAAAIVVIVGGGTVKRFQNYQTEHPGTQISLLEYVRTVAAREMPQAYANNYADGVRLIALARELLPAQAHYEYGKVLLQTAVQPVPAAIRPEIHSDPAIEGTFDPGNGNTYAMPLQAVAYMQLGVFGVLATFVLVGPLLARLDHRLMDPKPSRLSTWLFLVAAVANVPFVIRSGLPRGVAVAAIDVLGLWLVTRTAESSPRAPAYNAKEPGSSSWPPRLPLLSRSR